MAAPAGSSPASPYDALLGIEHLAASAGDARARVAIRDEVRQPAGLVHGGVLVSLAESLCVAATAAEQPEGAAVEALAAHTSFLRPAAGAFVHATARPRHRGRTTWVWEADLTDDDGRLCALVRVTVGVGAA